MTIMDLPDDATTNVVMVVGGELDVVTVGPVSARLQRMWLLVDQGLVIVDMSSVTFIDLAGLQPLMAARAQMRDRLWLRDPSKAVLQLLALADLGDAFNVMQTATAPAPDAVPPLRPIALTVASAGLSEVEALELHVVGLREGMRSRSVIEQAKGIVMASHRCSATQSFAVLSEASQTNDVKIPDLAAALVADADERINLPPGPRVRSALDLIALGAVHLPPRVDLLGP